MTATQTNLIKKYDVPGPRYTSYPTILHWNSTPTEDEWLQSVNDSIDDAEREGAGMAFYLHVPFCRSLCTYCGCNSRITSHTSVGRSYVKLILKEWDTLRKRLGRRDLMPITEMHLGGGTPTFLSAVELHEMVSGILHD